MNITQPKTQPPSGAELLLYPLREPAHCALPEFVKIPAVPGLPTELTGTALRNALQARADSGVSRRPA